MFQRWSWGLDIGGAKLSRALADNAGPRLPKDRSKVDRFRV